MWAKNFSKKFRKSLQIQKKVVPLQSRSETSGFLTPQTERLGTKKFIEKTERKVQASTEKLLTQLINKRASVSLWNKRQEQAKHYKKYTMKSLILAQDER